MGLFEWLGESFDPGPVGSVEVGARDRGNRSRISVLVCFGLALMFLVLWLCFALDKWATNSVASWLRVILGTLIYLILASVFHPRADTSNVGWLGGLIDHPFRFSDDINRFLFFVALVLFPGRFIAESFIDMGRLLSHSWQHPARRSATENPRSEDKGKP